MAEAVLPMPTSQSRIEAGRTTLRRLGMIGLITAATSLGGCVTKNADDVTGSIAAPASTMSQADMRAYTGTWGDRYRVDPTSKQAALNYARGLRALTQYAQAEAVLESAAIKAPYDTEILGAYGKALTDSGKFKSASEVLARAQNRENPNPGLLSAQGSVADQMGDHVQAQAFYASALKIRPADPSILSNLGLSYALSNDLPRGETTMRQAAESPGADMRVRQNLALVLALEGKFGEAEQVAQQDLPPADAANNIASIRTMIAKSGTWSAIQRTGVKRPAGRAPQRLQAALGEN